MGKCPRAFLNVMGMMIYRVFFFFLGDFRGSLNLTKHMRSVFGPSAKHLVDNSIAGRIYRSARFESKLASCAISYVRLALGQLLCDILLRSFFHLLKICSIQKCFLKNTSTDKRLKNVSIVNEKNNLRVSKYVILLGTIEFSFSFCV